MRDVMGVFIDQERDQILTKRIQVCQGLPGGLPGLSPPGLPLFGALP